MKVLLLCLVAVVLADKDPLREILKSPRAALTLYSEFKSKENLSFSAGEDRLRFRLFQKSAEEIAAANEDPEDTAVYGLNMFSTMTAEEKSQYLGYNGTSDPEKTLLDARAPEPSLVGVPDKLLWTDRGGVTPVKDQGGCGSCWSFSAIGGLETRYQLLSGVLRNFAEQEWLDCALEDRGWDGCYGGWIHICYNWSIRNGGRVPTTKDKPYQARDYQCKTRNVPDGMVAAKITSYRRLAHTDSAHIQALQTGSVAVAFEVTNRFYQYRAGIMRDTTCSGSSNHAVTMVGYASNYFLVKNQWGTSFGDRGFVRFSRNYHNCNLFQMTYYPELTETGDTDSGSDDATDYTPPGEEDEEEEEEEEEEEWCEDIHSRCQQHKDEDRCQGYSDSWTQWMKKHCQKTCKYCGGEKCPSGTIRCPDGVCRHEHMC